MNSASEITVVRCAARERFTSISNSILQNDDLSCEALAIFVHLLSRPDDWKVSIAHLAKHHRIGRDRVYRALGELRSAGFARLHTPRDPETGRVGKRHWIISEEGFADDRFPENQESGEKTGFLELPETVEKTGNSTGFLNSSKPDDSPVSWNHRKPVKSGHIQKNYLLQKNDSPQPPKGGRQGEDLPCDESEASAPVDTAEAWRRFSAGWPFEPIDYRRAAAEAEFAKLKDPEREAAIRAAPIFAKAWRSSGRSGMPDARSWLKARGWEAVGRAAPNSPAAAAATAAVNAVREATRLSDGSCRLHPSSPQLHAWAEYERRTLGRARIGLTRPSEWPPGGGLAERAARAVNQREAAAG
ncbi:MAG: Rrf2 family transcriptional regulator [Alphaproteobacteria bacterium]|nr:Rrf2 family transcriptional regulator [Alphaproteobacteria bacterium]